MNKKLLFTAALMLLGGHLLAKPIAFSEPVLLLKSSQNLMAPVWSPDGSKIAVTGDNYVGIWVANADGSSLQQVSSATGAGYQMIWSDAHNITSTPYTYVGQKRMTRIENVDVANGQIKLIADAERNVQRSKAINAPSVLKIMVDDPSNATARIAALNRYQGKMVINPALSPDGSKIAFQVVSKGMFVCNADGSNLISLGKGSHASWLPDNKSIMMTKIEDNGAVFTSSDIYCVNVETGEQVNITPSTEVIPVTIAVSPDGSKVAFDNDSDGCIYLINLK